MQATEKGLQLAERLRLPEGDELVSRLEQSKAPQQQDESAVLAAPQLATHGMPPAGVFCPGLLSPAHP
jgi:hypothetical protein